MMIIALMQKPTSASDTATEQYIQIRLFRIKPHVKIAEKKIYKSDEVERIGRKCRDEGKPKTNFPSL